jgi:hypothetical protein
MAMRTNKKPDLRGLTPESWHCVDCGVNTHPGSLGRAEMGQAFRWQNAAGALRVEEPSVTTEYSEGSEVYCVRNSVWAAAGMEPYGGCLCIGCLEQRLGRELRRKDFVRNHSFNSMPGTPRLLERRARP